MKDVDGEYRCMEGKVCFGIFGKNVVCFYVWRVTESNRRRIGRKTPCGTARGKILGEYPRTSKC